MPYRRITAFPVAWCFHGQASKGRYDFEPVSVASLLHDVGKLAPAAVPGVV